MRLQTDCTNQEIRWSAQTLIGAACAVLISIGALGCSANSGGANENSSAPDAAVAEATSSEADNAPNVESNATTSSQQGDSSATNDESADATADSGSVEAVDLPVSAVGSAGVTGDGSVFVVEDEPRRWTPVYDAAGTGGSPAVGASVRGSTLAYVLQDGSVHVQRIGGKRAATADVWTIDGGNSPAVAVDVSDKRIFALTAAGGVHMRDLTAGSATDSVVWTADQGPAQRVAAVKSGVFVLHDSKVSFVPTDGQATAQDLQSEGIADIDARGTRVAMLDGNGVVTVIDMSDPEVKVTVLWDGSGAEGKVTDISLGASLVMLLSDGTIRTKGLKSVDPSEAGRTVWSQVDNSGPAIAVGAHDKLVLFQLQDGRTRWADPSAPEGERNGAYFRGSGERAMVSFAS